MVILYSAIAVVIAFLSFMGISSYYFNRMLNAESDRFLRPSKRDSIELFDYGALAKLPTPVRRYLHNSVPDGYPMIRSVELTHNGYFRTDQKKDWWPVTGKEYFNTSPPAYLWIANISPFRLLWLKARDKYLDGHGEVLVRLLSGLTVVKSKNKKVTQSALIRFAGEMPWFPTIFAGSSYLRWEAIDNHSARAIITDNDIEVSVIYYFNDDNEIIRFFTKDRYLNQQKHDYTGYYRNYQEVNGIRIPTEIEAEWNLPAGDFSYAKFKLTNVIYNKFEDSPKAEFHTTPLHH